MTRQSSNQQGFTLIELMVVIVIIALVASLIMLNVNGVSHRKALQAREVFLMDMQKVVREANDQATVIALQKNTSEQGTYYYQFVELEKNNEITTDANVPMKWISLAQFKKQELPEKVDFHVTNLEQEYLNAQNQQLFSQNAPQMIWFGNGEVRPVRIQFTFEGQPIGAEIEMDHLGSVHEI